MLRELRSEEAVWRSNVPSFSTLISKGAITSVSQVVLDFNFLQPRVYVLWFVLFFFFLFIFHPCQL